MENDPGVLGFVIPVHLFWLAYAGLEGHMDMAGLRRVRGGSLDEK